MNIGVLAGGVAVAAAFVLQLTTIIGDLPYGSRAFPPSAWTRSKTPASSTMSRTSAASFSPATTSLPGGRRPPPGSHRRRRSPQQTGAQVMELTLDDFLLVSGLLFAIGFAGVLCAAISSLSSCPWRSCSMPPIFPWSLSRDSRSRPTASHYNGQMLVFFIITVAAAEVAVGLAVIVALYRARQTTHVEDISSLKF